MKTPSVNYIDYSKKDNPREIVNIHAIIILFLSFLTGPLFCWLNNIEYNFWILLPNAVLAFLNTALIMEVYIEPRSLKNEIWLGYKTSNFLLNKTISFFKKSRYSLIRMMNKMPWQGYNRKLLDILQKEVKNINDTFFEDKFYYHSYKNYSCEVTSP